MIDLVLTLNIENSEKGIILLRLLENATLGCFISNEFLNFEAQVWIEVSDTLITMLNF
jgi:hypothetical protein